MTAHILPTDYKATLLDIYADGGEWDDFEPVIDEMIAKITPQFVVYDTSTPEGHKARHELLHKMLDELVADWVNHTVHAGDFQDASIELKLPSNTFLSELMEWSYQQTQNPTEKGD